ncbi:MAG: MBL fold metallo-hydrolase [Candidatus Omnitrophica bacterium]|nr:MBL fold metallo-hydrolase [Candidatus Omnitrophota bacterium]
MKRCRSIFAVFALMSVATAILVYLTAAIAAEPKDAAAKTKEVNAAALTTLLFNNKEDFEDANRGFIAQEQSTVIKDAKGSVVWDLDVYSFLASDAPVPDTVNPSLWRQARLNLIHGLFKVTDHIYQVRGYDLSNISFVEGKKGYIVIDPLVSAEVAKAALELLYKHAGKKPVVAVIYTHSHIDHWGGVKGIVSEEEVRSGKVKIIASQGFLEEAISENVLAGNAMSRRAMYMYGNLLPKGAKGQVDAGLGKVASQGAVTIIPPTDIIKKTGETRTIDGVKIVFHYTPNTEAPTEMNFYFPQFKALCIAENCTHTLHNLYTLRGAKVRDAKSWSYFLSEAIELFGDKTDVMFASHHWPRWGQDRIVDMLKKQMDLYKYIHDQTLRLANHGYNMDEIAEMLQLPDGLAKEWYNRGYYGSLSHDVKAVYQRYLGWFDGNPANLNPLPPIEAGKKYVEYMGGSAAVLEKAKAAFENGEYRWVAQVLNHVVFAEPGNLEARSLEADALEQLGYQAESGPWRNFYLTGAMELRSGIPAIVSTLTSSSPDVIKAMPIDMFLDYLSVRLNGPKAAGKTIKINLNFKDARKQYAITLENSVLNYTEGKQLKDADETITLSRAALNEILTGRAAFEDKVKSGEIIVTGEKTKFKEILSLLDNFNPAFKIVDR